MMKIFVLVKHSRKTDAKVSSAYLGRMSSEECPTINQEQRPLEAVET